MVMNNIFMALNCLHDQAVVVKTCYKALLSQLEEWVETIHMEAFERHSKVSFMPTIAILVVEGYDYSIMVSNNDGNVTYLYTEDMPELLNIVNHC